MTDPTSASAIEQTVPCRWLKGFKRRASARHPCCVAASSQSAGAPSQETWVVNLSVSGIGLLLQWRPEPTTTLVVRLEATAHASPQLLWVQVVHVTEQAAGEWYVGCVFAKPLDGNAWESWLTACTEG